MAALIAYSLKLMRYFMVTCMVCMLLLIFTNVVMRYVFSDSIYIAEGISSLLFVWMTFVGAALVLYERGMIAVDVLIRRFPPLPQKICSIVVDVVMLGVAVLLLKGSWHQTTLNLAVMSSSTLLPAALIYAAGVFFSVVSGLFLVMRLVSSLRSSYRETHQKKSLMQESRVKNKRGSG